MKTKYQNKAYHLCIYINTLGRNFSIKWISEQQLKLSQTKK